MQSVIATQKLSKRYNTNDKYALHNLTLQVKAGEVYGFLGPNGAGKSTTIRILMNFLQPSSGSAEILGQDVADHSVALKQRIGYLSGDFAVYPKMTGRQFLTYMSDLQGGGSLSYGLELAKQLKADLTKKMGDLSRGNKQKIGLIQAFMHSPDVLILDEPTSGLDPLIQEEFYRLIGEAKQRNAAVFVSSHVLSEVQRMCDRVGIIREGKLIAERSIADMAKDAAHSFTITFAKQAPINELEKVKGLTLRGHHNNTVAVHMHGKLSDLFAVLAKCDVRSIDADSLDLETTFLKYYESDAK